MRLKITFGALSLLTSFLTHAQTITPFIGWTRTYGTLETTSDPDYRSTERRTLNIVGGLLVDIPVTQRLRFETGLGFAQRSFIRQDDYPSEGFDLSYQRSYNFNFLEVPVNASFTVFKSKPVSVAVKAGPRISYLVGGKVLHAFYTTGAVFLSAYSPDGEAEIKQSDNTEGFPDSGDMSYYYVKTRFAAAVNASVEVTVMQRATIELSWIEGMTHYAMFNRKETRLHGFQFTVGYPISLK